MPITPQFLAARAAEQRARITTYLPYPAPVQIAVQPPSFRFWRIARLTLWLLTARRWLLFPVTHYTERQRLELLMVTGSNAFLSRDTPLLGDVFQILWRLHPDFIRPDGELPNHRHPGQPPRYATFTERLRSLWCRRQLRRSVRRLNLSSATATLRAFLARAEQDAPTSEDYTIRGPRRSISERAPAHCAPDELCDYYLRDYALTRDEVLDSPRAWLHQLHRSRTLSEDPDADIKLIAPSDSIL